MDEQVSISLRQLDGRSLEHVGARAENCSNVGIG
jgi:hypothetical protein